MKLFNLIQKYPFLSNFVHATDGFIADVYSAKDYLFGDGTLKGEVLQEDGNWTNFLPAPELQKKVVETMACTNFALLNCLEILAERKYNKNWNKSDRYTAKMTGTTRRGNSMRKVLDITRKTAGTVDEVDYPYPNNINWNEFYKNIDSKLKKKGKEWLNNYEIKYERVWKNTQLMIKALKESPLYVSGFAWYYKDGLYRNYNKPNHAFTIVGYVEGKHWLAFDSYSPFIKQLEWDYDFGGIYKLHLNRLSEYNLKKVDKLKDRGFNYIMRTDKQNGGKGQIYKLNEKGLEELSENDKLTEAVRVLSSRKDLTGISEKDFNNLII